MQPGRRAVPGDPSQCEASILTAVAFAFLLDCDEFMYALAFTSSDRANTLPVAISEFAGRYTTDSGLVAAGGILAALPPVCVAITFQRCVVSGMAAGAVRRPCRWSPARPAHQRSVRSATSASGHHPTRPRSPRRATPCCSAVEPRTSDRHEHSSATETIRRYRGIGWTLSWRCNPMLVFSSRTGEAFVPMDRHPPGYTTRPAARDLLAGMLLGPVIFSALHALGALQPRVGLVDLTLLCAGIAVASWLVNQQLALAAAWRRAHHDNGGGNTDHRL